MVGVPGVVCMIMQDDGVGCVCKIFTFLLLLLLASCVVLKIHIVQAFSIVFSRKLELIVVVQVQRSRKSIARYFKVVIILACNN
jgi:hypothetical protein